MSRRGARSHASRLGDPGWPRPQHRHKLPEVSRFNPPPPAPNPTTHNRSHRATATQPFGQFSGQRRFGDSSVSTWGPPELSSQPHGPRTSLAPRAARQRRPPGNRPLNRHLKRSFALYETPRRKGKRREAEAPPPPPKATSAAGPSRCCSGLCGRAPHTARPADAGSAPRSGRYLCRSRSPPLSSPRLPRPSARYFQLHGDKKHKDHLGRSSFRSCQTPPAVMTRVSRSPSHARSLSGHGLLSTRRGESLIIVFMTWPW